MKNPIQAIQSVPSQDFFSLASRVLTSIIFIGAGVSKLREPQKTEQYMKSKNIPMAPVLSKLAAGVEILGGAALLLGVQPRKAALVLGSFLVPTTLIFHNFWSVEGAEREAQQVNFLKNVGILGSLVHTMGAQPGRLAVMPDQELLTFAVLGDPDVELLRAA